MKKLSCYFDEKMNSWIANDDEQFKFLNCGSLEEVSYTQHEYVIVRKSDLEKNDK